MEKPKQNLEESIYNRLKNIAKQRKRPIQEVLHYYAMERFLYRLSVSPYKDRFYLKADDSFLLLAHFWAASRSVLRRLKVENFGTN